MGTAGAVAVLAMCAIGGNAGVSSRDDYFADSHKPRFDPQDFPRFALTGHKAPRPEHDPRAVFFLPVKLELERPRGPAARSLAPDPSYEADSPRLIMDEDFNIRFDNPYIVPLTKPLALVLDSRAAARGRSGGQEKMMIPFPVLVKARKPLLDSEGFRDEDEAAEHRGADFDDPGPPKPPRMGKKWKNDSTAEIKKNSLYSLEDGYNASESDLYPGKIFAEMYRNMPVFDSEESREEPPRSAAGASRTSSEANLPRRPPPPRYAPSSTARPRASSETASSPWRPRPGVSEYPVSERLFSDAPSSKAPRASSETGNSPWRPKPGASKYPGSERLFSASTDLEWVTHVNSTKARTPAPARDDRESRIVTRDVNPNQEDQLAPQTATTTTASPEVTISRKFWRTV